MKLITSNYKKLVANKIKNEKKFWDKNWKGKKRKSEILVKLQSRQQDMTKSDSQRQQDTSCLVHLFSPFSQQLSLTVLSCGLYQLPTKACHNM